jgi:DNA-binding MarR family transcriptional regulator
MNFNRSIASSETQDVLDSIRRIVRALRISSRATEKYLRLSSAQLFILQKLGDSNGVSINELAAKTHTHQSSVSVVVGKLIKQGLAARRRSRADGRKVEVSITGKGIKLITRAPEPIQQKLIAAIEKLPARKRKILSVELKSVVARSGISDSRAPLFFEEK